MSKRFTLTKMIGGGESWYYLWDNKSLKLLDQCHEDDKDKMKELKDKMDNFNIMLDN